MIDRIRTCRAVELFARQKMSVLRQEALSEPAVLEVFVSLSAGSSE